MDDISDGARLLAEGQTIALADGSEHAVRFDNRRLFLIEEAFEGLLPFTNMLDDGYNGQLLNGMRRALAVLLDRTDEELVELFDVARRDEYRRALTVAFNEAMPPRDAPGKGSATAKGSRGASSTSTRSSRSASRRPSSGA